MKINNVTVKDPKYGGVLVTDESIWSKNTKRASSGNMTGTIVAWKTTIEVEWGRLSYLEAKAIRDAIVTANGFFTIEYNDFNASQTTSKTVYADHIPRQLLSLVYQRYDGIKIVFIEQ